MTFDELYAAHADRVYSFLRFKIRDAHLAEDIFQDTFLAAYQELSRNRLPDNPRAWILTIAHRRMVDRLRKMPDRVVPYPQLEISHPQDHPDLTEIVFLHDLLRRLDDLSRTIVYALYIEGLTIRETAHLTGLPEGTVKSRSFSARSKLSRWMKGTEDDE